MAFREETEWLQSAGSMIKPLRRRYKNMTAYHNASETTSDSHYHIWRGHDDERETVLPTL